MYTNLAFISENSILKYLREPFNLFSIGLLFVCAIVTFFLFIDSERDKIKNILRALPAFWTGLGVLLTFGSLLVGFSSIDLTQNENINRLPIILSNAFFTSIVGILIAQILNIILSRQDDQEAKEDHYKEAPEKLLYDLRHNSFIQNDQILNVLRDIDSSLKLVDRRFESAMPELIGQFTKTMDSISYNIKQNISGLNEDMFKQIQGILIEFKNISNSAGDHLKKVSTENASDVATEMKKLLEGLAGEVGSLKEKLSQSNQDQLTKHLALMELQEKSITDFGEKASASRQVLLTQSQDFQNQLIEKQQEGVSSYLNELEKIRNEANEAAKAAQNAYLEMVSQVNEKTTQILNDLKLQAHLVSTSINEWVEVSENTLEATSLRLKDSVSTFDNQKATYEQMLINMNLQLEELKNLYALERFTTERFEAYEGRTKVIEAGLNEMEARTRLLKLHQEEGGNLV